MSLNIDESPDTAEPHFSPPWHGAMADGASVDAPSDDVFDGPDEVIAGTGWAFASDGSPGCRTGRTITDVDDAEWGADTGATTAEYAITTLAACGFAALLVIILKSEPIRDMVTSVITAALGLGN